MGTFLGLIFHAIGGFAAGSFYLPFKLIKKWSWESSWLVLGAAAWILSPLLMAYLTTPSLMEVFHVAPFNAKLYTILFGLLWGVGGLTFGLSMRYLGMSLGMAVALGFTAVFGTLIPPIYDGRFHELMQTKGGILTLIGIAICILGIAVTGMAGVFKENELSEDQKKETIAEFNLKKGAIIAIISGVLSACFAFGLQAGKPIADVALNLGTKDIYQNSASLVWILWGGFVTNFVWTIALSIKNRSFGDFTNKNLKNKTRNYLLAITGGITWYFQFFFYGMGTTFLSKEFEFASWTIHIAFILLFSTLWGLSFGEWKGVSTRTIGTLWVGLLIIVLSTVFIGIGSKI